MDNHLYETEMPVSDFEMSLDQRQQFGSYQQGSYLPTGGFTPGSFPTGPAFPGTLPPFGMQPGMYPQIPGRIPTIPGMGVSPTMIQSYAAQYGGRPPTQPPQEAVALVQQLKANPQLLQSVMQARPRSLTQLYAMMGAGAPRSSEERGICPPGWEIVFYIGPGGIPQVDLVFNILPFFLPGFVVGFVAPFFFLQVITGVLFEICL
ncbi:hypothetical protein [Desertibacillus haloalkaliphilus]|uniref:hypothetical protein n=1 Tax=Desertibacillus haloalkaliphilus TaxID=1328930 RepID=UPI001C25CC37|nr:hypothetical protein [Desertibacillus haloalkaliphilus]MBU8907494.1 hypothetical protein [Desertibacillus haloalkaliphilus]